MLSRLDTIPVCDNIPSSHVAIAKTVLAERRTSKRHWALIVYKNKKLSWCWHTHATPSEVNQG